MNYIKALEVEVYRKKVIIQTLRRYLESEKFSIDNHVNRDDILLRIDEICGMTALDLEAQRQNEMLDDIKPE